MKIPARHAPLLFGALLSAIMVAIVSAFVVALNQGVDATFAARWLRLCAMGRPASWDSCGLETRRSSCLRIDAAPVVV